MPGSVSGGATPSPRRQQRPRLSLIAAALEELPRPLLHPLIDPQEQEPAGPEEEERQSSSGDGEPTLARVPPLLILNRRECAPAGL